MNFISRFLILSKVKVNNGLFLFSKNVTIKLQKGAKLIINNGIFRAGYSISDDCFSCFEKTNIYLDENSILEINGDLNLGPGTSLILNKNSHMIFGGSNIIAHNNTFFCFRKIEFGKNTCTSWNCQFMDSDGHDLYSARNGGHFLKPLYRPLVVEENVGFQMNVTIPRGITIGKNALISTGAILREDIPAESLVIVEQNLKIKKGIMTPYGKEIN